MPDYLLHGLAIRSDIPLFEEAIRSDSVDLRVHYGDTRPLTLGDDALIAEYVAYGRSWYSAYDRHGDYVLRIPEHADFVVSADLKKIEVLPVEDTDEEALGLLLAGTTLSFVLDLRGHCLLHAGAIDIGGHAVAFAGTTGRGKSTCVALMCALGRRLVTDDILRVELDSDPSVFRGGSSLRLRQRAAGLVDLFEVLPPTRITYDDRLAVSPLRSDAALPLGVILLPRPNRTIQRPHLERMSGAAALFGLLDAARFKGWKPKTHQQRQFEQFGELSRTVPVYRADLPWSEPITREVGEELLEELNQILSHG